MDDESLGDLVICLDVIKRQAKEHGLTVQEELGYMVLHGFLHLLGYDHEANVRDAKKMFTLQDDLFEKLLKKSKVAKVAVKKSTAKKLSTKPRAKSAARSAGKVAAKATHIAAAKAASKSAKSKSLPKRTSKT